MNYQSKLNHLKLFFFFASQFLYIPGITFYVGLSVFLNPEIIISVVPWSIKFLKTYHALTKQPLGDVFEIGIFKTWSSPQLFFYRTLPLTTSALNFIIYFQVVNSGCTVLNLELLCTWKHDSFICSFLFVIFSLHVGILFLIGSFSSN